MDYFKLAYRSMRLAKNLNDFQYSKSFRRVGRKNFNPEKTQSFADSIKYLYAQKSNRKNPETYLALAKQLEAYFHEAIVEVFAQVNLCQDADEFMALKYYDFGRSYESRLIGRLPTCLRLQLLYHLYLRDEDALHRSFLRSRMAVTLAKLNELDLAQRLAVYNWSLSEDKHFSDYANLRRSLKNIQEEAAVPRRGLYEELLAFYQSFIEGCEAYSAESLLKLDLIALTYTQYPQLHELSLVIKNYLRTGDGEAALKELQVMEGPLFCSEISKSIQKRQG
jgi:hypothetical protein